jgi:hypothetical protein
MFPPLENLHEEPFSIIYLFHPPTWLAHGTNAEAYDVRIFSRGEVSFAFYFCQVDLPNYWRLKASLPSKKKVHRQQFDIIHLLNPDLTYIRNFERDKIMLFPSTS